MGRVDGRPGEGEEVADTLVKRIRKLERTPLVMLRAAVLAFVAAYLAFPTISSTTHRYLSTPRRTPG